MSSVTEFNLNGTPVTVRGDHPHLLAALREELDVTSPKDGCSPSGSVRVLHGARRRQGGRQLQPRARQDRRQGRRHPRGHRRRRAPALRRGVRRVRRAAVRVLHPGHRRAGEVADRQEGRRPRPGGDGAAPRRPPVPVHRLRQDPRRHRGGGQGQDVPAVARRRGGCVGRQVRGRGAGTRRPRLCRRHARAGHAPRRVAPHRPRTRRGDVDRHVGSGGSRRRGRSVHGCRHPRRAARRDHPQGLADHDPGRWTNLVRRRRAGDRRRRDAPAGARRRRAGRGRLPTADAGHRCARGDRARCRPRRVGDRRERAVAQRLLPWRRRRRARRQRAHRPRGVPDPAHRARLPRTRVIPRRAVGRGRRPAAARLLRRPGRVGRPRRHLPRPRPADRSGHRRARFQRRGVRRQRGHGQPSPHRPRRVAARPASEVHAVARGELPHPPQAPPDPPRVLGRMRRRRCADRCARQGRRRLGRVRIGRDEGARAGGRPRHRAVPRAGRRRGGDRRAHQQPHLWRVPRLRRQPGAVRDGRRARPVGSQRSASPAGRSASATSSGPVRCGGRAR